MSYSEKAMAPHSNTLARRIPWTGEPGGLQSMGSRRVGHSASPSAAMLSALGSGVPHAVHEFSELKGQAKSPEVFILFQIQVFGDLY